MYSFCGQRKNWIATSWLSKDHIHFDEMAVSKASLQQGSENAEQSASISLVVNGTSQALLGCNYLLAGVGQLQKLQQGGQQMLQQLPWQALLQVQVQQHEGVGAARSPHALPIPTSTGVLMWTVESHIHGPEHVAFNYCRNSQNIPERIHQMGRVEKPGVIRTA